MKFGVFMFPTAYAIQPAELAREVESRGFDSLMFPEHTHIPASRESPFPGGGDLPQEYWSTYDPFVALMAAAAATERIRIGTGICLVIERDPIVLAKEVASLDCLSNGRFEFGIGGGWNREEMANHGTAFPKRWKILKERIEAMQQIWTQEEASYAGEFVNFDRIWAMPKPVQKPHPPIVVGGDGARTLERVIAYGDEWMPLARAGGSFKERIAELRDLTAAAGRDPIPVSLFAPPTAPEKIEAYREEGVTGFRFWLPPADRDTVLPRLDKLADLAATFR